jgi:hypothetical protein
MTRNPTHQSDGYPPEKANVIAEAYPIFYEAVVACYDKGIVFEEFRTGTNSNEMSKFILEHMHSRLEPYFNSGRMLNDDEFRELFVDILVAYKKLQDIGE